MRSLNLDFWARVVALLAGLVLALGLAMWIGGSPPTQGMRWVCWPAGMECWAIGILLRNRSRLLANLLLALSAAWLVVALILLLR
jgi:hypothetical protein